MTIFVHPTAEVHPSARIGDGSKIWAHAHIREHAIVGSNCIIGKGVLVDVGVKVGDNCKIQNNACLYQGTVLEDGVFVGPAVISLNDKRPRAINPNGTLKSASDWEVSGVVLKFGCAIGGGSILVPGVTVGRWAMVGSGATVSREIPDYGLFVGIPARIIGFVTPLGDRVETAGEAMAADPAFTHLAE